MVKKIGKGAYSFVVAFGADSDEQAEEIERKIRQYGQSLIRFEERCYTLNTGEE